MILDNQSTLCSGWQIDEPPYFYAFKEGETVKVKGTDRCFLPAKEYHNDNWHGPFVQWKWDGDSLHVWNDWSGFSPLYVWEGRNSVAISPSIPLLLSLGAPVEVDEAGLAVFLRLGFFIGDHTPFARIKALPPGTMLEWRDGTTVLRSDWKVGTSQWLRRTEAKERYAYLFKQAIRRRLDTRGSVALPLSGGRDSRHIVLELCDTGCPPTACLTYRHLPPRGNHDAVVAATLCAALRLKYIVLSQANSRLGVELRKNILTSFCADELAEYISMADYVKDTFETLYDGIGGDVLSNGLFLDGQRLSLYGDGRFSDLAENIMSHFQVTFRSEQEPLLRKLLHRRQYQDLSRDVAVHSLSTELRKHADAPNPIASFFFWNRTRREIALSPHAILAAVARVHCPYLDRELYEFLASLPAEFFVTHTFHDETIKMAYSSMADIPYDKDVEAEPTEQLTHSREFSRQLLAYAFSNLCSRFIKPGYLLPRLFRGALANSYGHTFFSGKCLGPYLVYLLQLERTMANPSTAMTA